jgi:pyruvate dehydrogenase (quinone)
MTGLLGFSSGYRAMEHCDALLMLGTDFPYLLFYPEGVPVIQVNVRPEQIGRRVPVDVPLVGAVKDTIDALLPLLAVKSDSAHLDRMTAHYRRARARLDRLDRLATEGRTGSPCPAVRRRDDRPARERRCDLHRGRRFADDLGRRATCT